VEDLKTVKSLLPEREIAICRRLRQVRIDLKWNQPDFARELKISRERLASYEYAKAPVRYWLGRTLGQRFDVNQRWLATGELPRSFYLFVHGEIENRISPRILFSEAYEQHLKPFVEAELRFISETVNLSERDLDASHGRIGSINLRPCGEPVNETLSVLFNRSISTCFRLLPSQLAASLFQELANTTRSFADRHKEELSSYSNELAPKPSEETAGRIKKEQAMLDTVSERLDDSQVQNRFKTLPELLEVLRKLTSERGVKASLGRELNVSRQAVDQWLSGQSKPSADSVLLLLDWIERISLKQKQSPASALTPAEQKTQLRKSSNENHKSGPRRR
jgi:transcriptional regulator with XRE-family HTH domain